MILRKVFVSQIALLAWIFIFITFVCLHRVDPDYGWHFSSGRYILSHGVPHHDVFTYTARSFPWVDHEWLSDVFIYTVASKFGYKTLAVLFAMVWAMALWIGMRKWHSWIVTGIGLGGILLYIGARSDAWTALGIALVLWIIDLSPSQYPWLVPITAIWANLHAGFAAGLALMLLKVFTNKSRSLAKWTVAAAAATVINPYGVELYVELARTLGDAKLSSSITEWAPLSLNQDVAPYLVAICVCLVIWRGSGFARMAGTGLLAAAIWSNRNMSLLVVGTAAMLGDMAHHGMRVLRSIAVPLWLRSRWTVLYPIALLLYPPTLPGSLTLTVPSMALASLKSAPCSGHLFNDYNYGGLIIWKLPGVPDFIDGRMPSWTGPQGRYLDIYNHVLEGNAFTGSEFNRYNVRCAIISKYDTKLSAWLSSKTDWHLTVNTQDAQLWRQGT
jgi:hypothetical protein